MKLNIYYERQENGWSQVLASEVLGISRSYYSMIEKGVRNPSLKLLKRLEELFGHSHDYLLSQREDVS